MKSLLSLQLQIAALRRGLIVAWGMEKSAMQMEKVKRDDGSVPQRVKKTITLLLSRSIQIYTDLQTDPVLFV